MWYNVKNKRSMKTTELKELMPTNKADIQGYGIIEFYTPEQVVEILRLLGVVGQSEQLVCDKCYDTDGFYLGTTCPKCKQPFRSVKA